MSKLLRGTLHVSSKVLKADLINSVCSAQDVQTKLLELCAKGNPPIPVEFDVHYRSDILQAYKTERDLRLTYMLLYIWSDFSGRRTKAVFLALLPSQATPRCTSESVLVVSNTAGRYKKTIAKTMVLWTSILDIGSLLLSRSASGSSSS